MRSSSRYFLLFLFIVLLFGVYLISGSQQFSTNSTQSSCEEQVLATEDANAKCHAHFLNKLDVQAVLPDHNCTPGAINSDVTQDNIDQTICHSGFTKTIRPPVSYTNRLKREQIQEYGFVDTSTKDYEEDHMISLELGGSPSDPKNLGRNRMALRMKKI